jgi:hypothetical protein
MATKKVTTTNAPGVETKAAGAPKGRAPRKATPRVTTVKHSMVMAEPVIPNEKQAVSSVAVSPEEAREAIAKIAYGYWESRGYQGGNAAEDWIRAEGEYHGRSV